MCVCARVRACMHARTYVRTYTYVHVCMYGYKPLIFVVVVTSEPPADQRRLAPYLTVVYISSDLLNIRALMERKAEYQRRLRSRNQIYRHVSKLMHLLKGV